jgi:hypothetical protein
MTDHEVTERDPMGPAIIRGIVLGIPVVLVGLSIGIWLITDLDIFESMTTALLPGILLGAVGGGFAGMAATMKE